MSKSEVITICLLLPLLGAAPHADTVSYNRFVVLSQLVLLPVSIF
ncbi:MAG: hypothetical protein JWQ14_2209 [Adhaeribacter sp.]|jgi:hypothetical protein|nr:hypothetical protein [Adhaeribacter sp.]